MKQINLHQIDEFTLAELIARIDPKNPLVIYRVCDDIGKWEPRLPLPTFTSRVIPKPIKNEIKQTYNQEMKKFQSGEILVPPKGLQSRLIEWWNDNILIPLIPELKRNWKEQAKKFLLNSGFTIT